ncbi:MAG TPA: hypothetical protein VHQ24_01530, partial [Lachnospiraceae bacterium]|nr:hypothetical protein [Lachnospiraceae bacterium]
MKVLEQGSLELIGKECFGALAEVSLLQSFGSHGCLTATVWLRPDKEWDENSKQWEDMPISLIPTGRDWEPLFSGIVTSSCFLHIGGRSAVKLEAYSYTILLDRNYWNRSCQQESITYDSLLRSMLAPYQASYIWHRSGHTAQVGRFLMQYRESDWEFLRRIASLHGHPIIPEIRYSGAKIYIGLPERKAKSLKAERYRIKKNLEKTSKRLDNKTTGGLSEGLEYEVSDRYENYQLGDVVEFLGTPLIVAQKYSSLRGNQWVHDYSLRPENNCRMERMDNLELAGAAVKGTVLGTNTTSSKLALETDMEGLKVESWHIQPVYYAGGGKGYSGQPEKGDSQYLYFPTMREEDRYIIGGADAGEEQITAIVEKASSEDEEEKSKDSMKLATGASSTSASGTVNIPQAGASTASASVGSSAGGTGKTTPQTLSKTKSWTTPGSQKLILNDGGISLSNSKQSRISVSGSGITVRSPGSLTLETEEILGTGKNLKFEASEYVWINCQESGILLLPDTVHMKAEDIYIMSPENLPHEIVNEDAIEELLNIYEGAKKSTLPLFASDGSVISRDGYDEITETEEMYQYFHDNVYGKGDYENLAGQPEMTLYEGWLDETYGRSALGKFWDYTGSLDGFQDMLDGIGFIFDVADLLNTAIYYLRGKKEEGRISLICSIPGAGSVIGKGSKIALGATVDISAKLGKNSKKVIESLELMYKTTADGVIKLRKYLDNALDTFRSGMNMGDNYRLAFAYGDYFDDAGKITFNIVDETGKVTSYTKYMDEVVDGGKKVDIEGVSDTISDIDKLKISKWTDNPISDEIYLKNKKTYDNPKYFNQDTGEPIWPGMNGDVNKYGFLNGVYSNSKLTKGMVIDRYGGNNGTF